MKTIHLRKQSGSSLAVVLSILATLMVIVGVAAEYTWTVNRHVQRSNTMEDAVAVADSCIDILFANWRSICRSPSPTTALTTSAFAVPSKVPLPTASQLNLPSVTNFAKTDASGSWYDPAHDDYAPDYTISNYKIVAVTPEWTALPSASAAPIPELGLAQTGNINTTAANFDYIASADVTLPALGPTRTVVAKVRRVFQKQQLSPWNFAIFYVDPLEIHPGPQFTVTGWVHTNSDLYTGHNTLTFADKVTYGSDWYAPTTAQPTVGFKPGDLRHPQPPLPTAPNYPSNLPPAHDDAKQPLGLDSTLIFNWTDVNPNNDSYRELIQPPVAGYTDPLPSERYWNQADVIIQVDNSNTVTIGKSVNGIFTALPSSDPLYNMFITSGAITPNQSITDNREGGSIRLVTLDLSKIQNNTGGLNPTFKVNIGIIYIYDSSATTHSLNADGSVNQNPTNPVRRGVRLKNGSKIASTGLTIASPNPVYIQGDYNTGRDYSGSTNPPSNNTISDPTAPQVSGYTRAPCSILSDAVNILSNSWIDSASGSAPPASNTTINTAIVSGIVPTAPVGGDGSYSGGAENFPRFLETWTGHTLTYYGSMVELYKSQQSIGEWGQASVYSPPIRQWYFDSNFKIKPPPGTLMVYSYVKGKWSLY